MRLKDYQFVGTAKVYYNKEAAEAGIADCYSLVINTFHTIV